MVRKWTRFRWQNDMMAPSIEGFVSQLPFKVLFVCTGNICRSPTAHAVFREMVRRGGLSHMVISDSCGVASEDIDEPPDERAQYRARLRGYDLSDLRARAFRYEDGTNFDLILAMDRGHLKTLREQCDLERIQRTRLFLEFALGVEALEVPDPYYGSDADFDMALDLIEAGVTGLLDEIRRVLVLSGAVHRMSIGQD
jgi:protein-tyrosine phosphatase